MLFAQVKSADALSYVGLSPEGLYGKVIISVDPFTANLDNITSEFKNTLVDSATPLEVHTTVQWWENGVLHSQLISSKLPGIILYKDQLRSMSRSITSSYCNRIISSPSYTFYITFDWILDGQYTGAGITVPLVKQ